MKDFDFEPALNELVRKIEQSNADTIHTALESIFAFPEFYEFAQYYYSDPRYIEYAEQYWHNGQNDPPFYYNNGGLALSGPYIRPWDSLDQQQDMQDARRSEEAYFLNRGEIKFVQKFLGKYPEYYVAMASIQGCCAEYIAQKTKALKRHTEEKTHLDYDKIDERLQHMTDNAEGFSFLHDLLPALIALAPDTIQGCPHQSGKNEGQKLSTLFRDRQIFRSMDDKNEERKCPFSSSFIKVMSTKLAQDPCGGIVAEKGQFGDFFRSVRSLTAPYTRPKDREYIKTEVLML